MPDRTFLDWPFFEPRHRDLAAEAEDWAARTVPALVDHKRVVEYGGELGPLGVRAGEADRPGPLFETPERLYLRPELGDRGGGRRLVEDEPLGLLDLRLPNLPLPSTLVPQLRIPKYIRVMNTTSGQRSKFV